MATMDRPRQVVFNLLKQTWGITHQETFAILGTGFAAANYSGERKLALRIQPEIASLLNRMGKDSTM